MTFTPVMRRDLRQPAICAASLGVAALLGLAAPRAGGAFILGIVALSVIAFAAARPAAAAYIVIGVTPLITGIDRGSAIPVLRPNEALLLLLLTGVAARSFLHAIATRTWRIHLSPVEIWMVALAVTGSIVPLLWMSVRGAHPTADDYLYALVLWKYAAVYLLIRLAVTSERTADRCLGVSMATAVVIGGIAMLQAVGVSSIAHELARFHYTSNGNNAALQNYRGSSTIGLAAAMADLMILNLAIAVGMFRRGRHRRLFGALAVLFALAAVSSGEFSSAIALLVAAITISLALGTWSLVRYGAPVLAGAYVVLRPVIDARLSDFHSASGLPTSWTGRLVNLRTFFWPVLRSDFNYVLGVRPAARVPDTHKINGFVWIESGYTWLLWAGGIPMLIAFVGFAGTALARGWRLARRTTGAVGVAGLAVCAGMAALLVSMVFDPHLTYRGSADALFVLLALTAVRAPAPAPEPATPIRPQEQVPMS